jgi:hypothetical protein
MGIDRGEGLPPLIGEAEKQHQALRLRAWVSKTEVPASEEVTVFAAVERNGKPLAHAPVVVIVDSTKDGLPKTTNAQTDAEGLASVRLPGSIFRLALPSQILVSVMDGADSVDVELRIFVDTAGGAVS